MKKAFIAGILAITIILVAGCTREEITAQSNPFIGGTSALSMNFVSNSPPAEIFDKPSTDYNPFDIIVDIKNVGESDIAENKLKLTLAGIYSGDFVYAPPYTAQPLTLVVYPIFSDQSISVLEGRKKGLNDEVLPGGVVQYAWPSLAYNKKLEGTLPNMPIEVSACYEYKTKVMGIYCLKKNPLETREGFCEVSGAKSFYNSAGPVQLTSFSEDAAGLSAVSFTFNVKKVGSGEVSKPGQMGTQNAVECSSTYSDRNKVYVKVNSGIAGALSCSGLIGGSASQPTSTFIDGYLSLDSATGEGIFTCRLNTASASDSVRDLNIDLVYNYLETISKRVTIKHLLS